MEIADHLTSHLKKFNKARTIIIQEQTIGGSRQGGLPVQFVIQAPDFEKLKSVLVPFVDKARQDPLFQSVDVNLKFNKPEIEVEINRERARIMNVSVNDIAQTLQLYFSGQRIGYFIKGGKQYQVIAQAEKENRDDPADLKNIFVKSGDGKLVQLDDLVKLTEKSSPPQLYRYNRFISATISAGPAPGITLGQGIKAMEKIASEVLDDSFSTALAGPSKEFTESSSTLLFAFFLALALVYLILAAQFESFSDPLIIMFTVPLALAGAILALWITNSSLNIFSQIGIIVLVGIVTKNGILIVEFANQKKRAGINKATAVYEAALARLRPILMTSLATILGVLPIALALGAASASRSSMGISIIGGLLFSLILTLFIIPGLYIYLSGNEKTA